MPETVQSDYKQKIKDLLANYVDGWDVFKVAKDWDHPLVRVPGAENKDIPGSWLELAETVIGILAHDKYGLKTYVNEIEIISAEQMLDAYSSVGMPINYNHWSHGKQRTREGKAYEKGQQGLAYEIVINTNPCKVYNMGQNTKLMQMLVIAHAGFGHNSFFRNNHMFTQFTEASTILGDLERLKADIEAAEDKYGYKEVERLLDAAHALESYAVDRYNKPKRRTAEQEKARRKLMEDIRQQNVNHEMDTALGFLKPSQALKDATTKPELPKMEREENILQFIAANAPHLKEDQRNILRQICDKAQYFYPQRQTQVMNEGWASFWHYTLLNDLHEMQLIDDGMSFEFVKSHTGVLFQPDFDSDYFSGINPYALGFAIYTDIKRICENPTAEDREWFPDIAGKEWLPTLKHAMENYKDESFVLQFLSPKVMRDLKLFAIRDDDQEDEYEVSAIHDDEGYKNLRAALASQYRLGDREPSIEVVHYDYAGDRSLTLQHTVYNRRPVDSKDTKEVMKHVFRLWGHPVVLKSVDADGDEFERPITMPESYTPQPPTPSPQI